MISTYLRNMLIGVVAVVLVWTYVIFHLEPIKLLEDKVVQQMNIASEQQVLIERQKIEIVNLKAANEVNKNTLQVSCFEEKWSILSDEVNCSIDIINEIVLEGGKDEEENISTTAVKYDLYINF